jgi:hypothetical protein
LATVALLTFLPEQLDLRLAVAACVLLAAVAALEATSH